jgi:hypothetical protein
LVNKTPSVCFGKKRIEHHSLLDFPVPPSEERSDSGEIAFPSENKKARIANGAQVPE